MVQNIKVIKKNGKVIFSKEQKNIDDIKNTNDEVKYNERFNSREEWEVQYSYLSGER